MLPTNNGFEQFFGNLYHLNAEEEPENPDYPQSPAFKEQFGPRGVIRSAGHARRRPADRGHRPADPGAHGDRRRGGHRRGARLHGQGACRRQAVLPVVELHPHAHLHPPEARVRGRDRPRHLRRRHGRARRPGRPAARQARRARHRRQHHRDVLDRQRRRDLHLARRRHHDVPRREEHQLGGRLPRADPDPLAGRDRARHRRQRHRRARGHADDAARRRRRARHQGGAADRQAGRRPHLQGPPRRLRPRAGAQGRGRLAAPRVPLLDRRRQRRGAALRRLEGHLPAAERARASASGRSRSRSCAPRRWPTCAWTPSSAPRRRTPWATSAGISTGCS